MQSIGLPEAILNSINRIVFTFSWKKETQQQESVRKSQAKNPHPGHQQRRAENDRHKNPPASSVPLEDTQTDRKIQ